jgi:fatty-acyl-CoA synthase
MAEPTLVSALPDGVGVAGVRLGTRALTLPTPESTAGGMQFEGEIQVRGDSLMSGYVGSDVPDPFVDGWLRTGDMGYLADGELYVTGRAKDMVIAMGINYYPEDFEWAAARVDGVRPGRCAAFNLPDTDDVVVLIEATNGDASTRLEREVRSAVANTVGISPSAVVALPPGTVKKTTSGKLRRAAMR